MSMDWPAALTAIANSTRELPLSTVLVAALATGSSASASPPQAVSPTASATTCRATRTRLICKASKQIQGLNRVTRMGD